MESSNENEERERVIAEIDAFHADIQRGLTEKDTAANNPLVTLVRLLDAMKKNILDPGNASMVFSQVFIEAYPPIDPDIMQRFKAVYVDYVHLPHGKPW